MKITIDQRTLRDAVDKTALFIPRKSTLPALECMCISANGKLEFSATDLETSIHLTVPLAAPFHANDEAHTLNHGVKTDIEGTVNVPSELFQKAIDSMKDGCQTTLESDSVTHRLQMRIGSQLVASMKMDEAPELVAPAVMPQDAREFFLEIEKLRAVAAKCLPFVSDDDLRPPMQGVLFAYDGTNFTATSSDGMRLVQLTFPMVAGPEPFQFVVPAVTLAKACKVLSGIVTIRFAAILGKHNGEAGNESTQTLLQFASDNIEITARAIEEQFPNVGAVIQRATETAPYHLTANRADMIGSLERLALIATGEGTRVQLRMRATWEVDHSSSRMFAIHAENYNRDEAEEYIRADFESTESGLTIDFNGTLLRRTLETMDAEDVTTAFTANNRAAVIRETFSIGPEVKDGPKFDIEALYLIMPLSPEPPRDDMRGTALQPAEVEEANEVTA